MKNARIPHNRKVSVPSAQGIIDNQPDQMQVVTRYHQNENLFDAV
jgi:hypothetical protein